MTVSAEELRGILDEVMERIDADPDDVCRLRAAAAPLRLDITDLRLVMNIRRGEDGHLRWDFKQRQSAPAKLALAMDSEVANRLFQGRENPAIAIARGRLRTTVSDAGAALRLFPAFEHLAVRYRELVATKYPHLAV
jgi:hypothetical protein